METLYRLGEATVAQVQEGLDDAPNYNAVRGLLRILAEKGLVQIRQDGVRYLFSPTVPKEQAAKSALTNLMRTFFDGSVESTVATLLSERDRNLSDAELDRIAQMIEHARRHA